MGKRLGLLVAALLASLLLKVQITASAELESVPPEQAGISSSFLYKILNQIRVGKLDIHSLIVIKNHKLVLEAYLDPYTRNDLHNLKSVSKSVLSALAGIAIDQEAISGVNATLSEALPDFIEPTAEARKHEITLLHLLTMTSGLDFTENSERAGKWFKAKNPVRDALALPISSPPGQKFQYATINTHLFSAWLTKAAGASTAAFAEKNLFRPLGITEYFWVKDPQGVFWGGTQLYLSPRKMARFGLLYLDKGRHADQIVVPEKWVSESIKWRESVDTHSGYGYWWWLIPGSDGYVAAGWGGQRIGIFPSKDLVIVITAANQQHSRYIFRQLYSGITPITSLENDPAAFAQLTELVDQLANPALSSKGSLPATAALISGKTYRFDSNPLGIESMAISFDQPESAMLQMDVDGQSLQLRVGLDGGYRITPQAALDSYRPENRVAVRARWEGELLIVDWHEIGEPMRIETSLMFQENSVSAVVKYLPQGRISHLEGRKDD